MHRSPLASRAALLAALLAALALGAGCATAGSAPIPQASRSVAAVIGDAACDTDAHCATIGVGAKACGGPAAYVAWSTLRTDGERLRAEVEREAAAQRAALAASGRLSDCAVVPDPGAYCDRSQARPGMPAGVCRLRSGGGSRSPAAR